MHANDRREEYIVMFAGLTQVLRKFYDARQRSRRLYHAAMTAPTERIAAVQAHDKVQALVENSREWPRRIESQRRQHRNDLLVEILAEPGLLLVVPLMALHKANAGFVQLGEHDLIQQLVLLIHELSDLFTQAVEQLL